MNYNRLLYHICKLDSWKTRPTQASKKTDLLIVIDRKRSFLTRVKPRHDIEEPELRLFVLCRTYYATLKIYEDANSITPALLEVADRDSFVTILVRRSEPKMVSCVVHSVMHRPS